MVLPIFLVDMLCLIFRTSVLAQQTFIVLFHVLHGLSVDGA